MKHYTIYNQSSEAMAEVASASIDLIVVDPPFNVGTTYGTDLDTRSRNEQACLMKQVAKEVYRVCRNDGKVLVLASDTVFTGGKYLEFARQLQDIYVQAGFNLLQRHIVFIKHHDGVQLPECAQDWQGYQAVGDAHSSLCHLLVFGVEGSFTGGEIRYTNYEVAEGHPCPFPPDFLSWVLASYYSPGMTVLEPFMGTGRLGQEVVRRGGTYTGYEISEQLFRAAKKKFAA